jgi:YhcG PDDEXK nuclease domain
MNFYLNAVDEQLRVLDDRESVGIILCASGDATVAKLALHRVLGVARSRGRRSRLQQLQDRRCAQSRRMMAAFRL